eukprot:gene6894-9446_t
MRFLFGFVISVLIYIIFCSIYETTYVWQSTTLSESLRPVKRNNCLLNNQNAVLNRNSSSTPLSFAIIMLYNNNDGNWNEKLMKRVIENRMQYCNKHGYTLINANQLLDNSRPAAWSKIKAVRHYLLSKQFDYVMYMDMDVVIMNQQIKLESLLNEIAIQHDLLMTSDWSGLNTGIWLAKNSTWSSWFLELAWNQKQFLVNRSPEGIAYPFLYEQRAFHYLLDTDVWKSRKLPKYDGNITELKNHIFMFPQCGFNSYSMHPLERRGNREESQYIKGDFLIHLAGKKGKARTNLMEYYLNLVN